MNDGKLDIRYFVNENGRHGKTVACTIYVDPKDVKYEYERIMDKVDHVMSIPMYMLGPEIEINTSYTGKAVCHPEDKFDLELGKRLAKTRALKKYNDAKLKRFLKLYDAQNELRDRLCRTLDFYEARLVENDTDEFDLTT